MNFYETEIPGVFIIEPKIIKDSRGYFFESYNEQVFRANGIKNKFVQDNQSLSSYGTIRGIHAQKGASAQAKLVRAVRGQVLDVAVDLRPGSPTFGKHVSVLLNDEENNMLFIPRGFGHGFSVQSETAIFGYKCDNFYNKESESGIIYNDPEINIDWKIPAGEILTSDKDLLWPTLSEWRTKGSR